MAPNAPEVGMTTGATIHTTNGLWMNVKPRANIPPSPPSYGSHAAAASNGNGSGGGCPMHSGNGASSPAAAPAKEPAVV
jgi:hypothetical protein